MGVRGLLSKIAGIIFPYIPVCAVCGAEKGVTNYLCKRCENELEELKAGEPSTGGFAAFSLYKYDGAVKSIITGYKYGGKKYLGRFFGGDMAKKLGDIPCKLSYVCNVPLHEKRRKQRGFDQAEELAKGIAQAAGIPYIAALRRIRNTKTQTKLSETQRALNIKGAFEAAETVTGNVLLVDDVLTTGATAGECVSVLMEAGAKDVYVMTFARAVMRGSRQPKDRLRRLIKRSIKV
jgi:ComF family protein